VTVLLMIAPPVTEKRSAWRPRIRPRPTNRSDLDRENDPGRL